MFHLTFSKFHGSIVNNSRNTILIIYRKISHGFATNEILKIKADKKAINSESQFIGHKFSIAHRSGHRS